MYTVLHMSGYGVAENYTWKEDALEIEVTVQVPPGTNGKDVYFKPGIASIDLRVKDNSDVDVREPLILLHGSRKLRGRIVMDGTYWVFSDRRRSITVTLEKYFAHSNDDMQVLDYDWKGVYPKDEEEVKERKYDEPEVLNVREYAASLGVDVDNINRSMVDEAMFSSGLNLTQKALEQLTEQGYLTEVTKQADGTEWTTNSDGEAEPLKGANIPFIDTNSPWHEAVPVSVDQKNNKTTILDTEQLREIVKENAKSQIQESEKEDSSEEGGGREGSGRSAGKFADPIDMLTVKRLKEILNEQGLKVSGSQKELQDRLRNEVNSLLRQSQDTQKS